MSDNADILDRNWASICGVARSISMGETGLTALPRNLIVVLKSEAWRQFRAMGTLQENGSLEEFLTSAMPKGLGSNAEELRRLVALAPDSTDKRTAMDLLLAARKDKPGPEVGAGVADIIRNQGGTSEPVIAERLRRKEPALYERVKAGELTASAAAIEAGWRKKTVTVPIDVTRAADTLFRHFEFDDLELLIKELQERLAR